jgi:hypothetical protein
MSTVVRSSIDVNSAHERPAAHEIARWSTRVATGRTAASAAGLAAMARRGGPAELTGRRRAAQWSHTLQLQIFEVNASG